MSRVINLVDNEELFKLRNAMNVKHGYYHGMVGCGKTTAIKDEIAHILEETNDSVIVVCGMHGEGEHIRNDDGYDSFCEMYNGQSVALHRIDSSIQIGRLTVIRVAENILTAKAMDFIKKEMVGNTQSGLWVFIDNLNINNEIKNVEALYMAARKYKTTVTVCSGGVDTWNNSIRLSSNVPYVRVFKVTDDEMDVIVSDFGEAFKLVGFKDFDSVARLEKGFYCIQG